MVAALDPSVVESMGYRDLQHACKAAGLVATGKTAVLRLRLRNAVEAGGVRYPAAAEIVARSSSEQGFHIVGSPPRSLVPLRSLSDPLVASNFTFALCSALYAASGHWLQAALVLGSCAASCAYHRSREKRYVVYDRIGAVVAFMATLRPLAPLGAAVKVAIALDCVVAFSFYFRCGNDHESRTYAVNHSMWHASIFVGQMIVACALLATSAAGSSR
jgi:hypothetical protein